MHLDTALACALVGAASGWFVPQLIARIPEPADEPVLELEHGAEPPGGAEAQVVNRLDRDAPAKEPYVDLAARPGLAWMTALASGLAAGAIGATTGWVLSLTFLLFLCPVGVALAFIDFRTWLLPTRIIAPSYLVVTVLVVLVGVTTQDWDDLGRAFGGWLAMGLVYLLIWYLTPAMGYGDVRLAGLLGIALGYLGWGQLVTGLYAGFVIGVVLWVPMRLLRITKTSSYPAGPFILAGALVGVLCGHQVGMAWGDLAGR